MHRCFCSIIWRKTDVLVLATPVYFYGISAQMKTFIDRTYPIWQHLGKKEVYYIISAGLGEDIIERSLGDLNGFVEHLEEYKIPEYAISHLLPCIDDHNYYFWNHMTY